MSKAAQRVPKKPSQGDLIDRASELLQEAAKLIAEAMADEDGAHDAVVLATAILHAQQARDELN